MQHTSSLYSLAQCTHARWSTLHTSLRLLALASLLTISASSALAQTYTYQYPIDVTLAGLGFTHITGTGEVNRVGTYVDNTRTERSWYYHGKTKTYSKISHPGKRLMAADISPHARIVGTYYEGHLQRGFSLQGGTFKTITVPDAQHVQIHGINAGHQIVGTYHPNGSGQWVGMLMDDYSKPSRLITTYAMPNAYGTDAYGANLGQDVVGGYLDMDPAQWRYRGWIQYGFGHQPEQNFTLQIGIDAPCAPSGANTIIRDINDAGLMAVTCDERYQEWPNSIYALTSYAFDGTTWTELEVPGSTVTHVTKLNNLGHFVGWYVAQDGSHHGFIAKKAAAVAQR